MITMSYGRRKMNSPDEIKQIITPIMVAQRYLGTGKQKGNKLWYKSPFRNERTASFLVDNKSFHDFGDDWDGDIFSFIQRYYNTNFANAMKIIISDFGLPEQEKIDKDFKKYIKQKAKENQQVKLKLDDWFNSTFNKITKQLKTTNIVIKYVNKETLKIAYDTQSNLEILWELFFNAIDNEKEKINLWRDRESIEKCLNN